MRRPPARCVSRRAQSLDCAIYALHCRHPRRVRVPASMEARMLTRRALLTTGLGLAFATTRAIAHHSTAMYDMATPVTVKGTVKRFEWTNPHAFIFLDVKDDKGESVEWEIELMSLNHLRSYRSEEHTSELQSQSNLVCRL